MTLNFSNVTAGFSSPLAEVAPVDGAALGVSANVSDPDVNGRSYRRAALTSCVRGRMELQFECWWDADHKMVIARRARAAASDNDADWSGWNYFVFDGTNGLLDIELSNPTEDHASVVIGTDPNGYLHVCYDTRNSPLNYRMSDRPVETWNGGLTDTLTMVSAHNESTINYPQFFNDHQGNLCKLSRRGSAGSGVILFYIYDHRGDDPAWKVAPGTSITNDGGTVTGVLIDGLLGAGGYNTAFIYAPSFDPDFDFFNVQTGVWMHLAFHWRPGGANPTISGQSNRDVTYIGYSGEHFYHADGEAQSIPVTPFSENDVVDPVVGGGTGAGVCLGGASNVDSYNNLPALVYPRHDASAYINAFYAHFNGTAWQTPVQVTNNATLSSTGDPENADWRSPMLNIRQSDGLVTIATNRFGQTGVQVHYSDDHTTFTDVQVDARDAGQWSPSCDVPLWHRREKLMLPVQSDPGYREIIEWDSSAVAPVTMPAPTLPSLPSDEDRAAAVATFIAALASSGLDASMATFLLFMRMNGTDAVVDIINDTVAFTTSDAVNFQPWKGYKTNGLYSYGDTGFNPSTDGAGLYTQNDAHFGLYSWTAAQSDGVNGVRDQTSGTKQVVIRTRSTADLLLAGINSSGTDTIASTDGSGHFIIERTSSSNCQAYRNGASIGTFTETSSAPPNGNFFLGARNQIAGAGAPSGFGARQFGLFHAGASLGTTDAATLGGLVDDLVTALWP